MTYTLAHCFRGLSLFTQPIAFGPFIRPHSMVDSMWPRSFLSHGIMGAKENKKDQDSSLLLEGMPLVTQFPSMRLHNLLLVL